ncbi:MAG: hypothetical protein ACP5OA_07810 [Candidatus Woesearchaeota archaeon]
MKRSILIIRIDDCSYDYDILGKYLCTLEFVIRVSCIVNGFIIDLCYEEDVERKSLLKTILKLDVSGIEIHDVLYEEFLEGR